MLIIDKEKNMKSEQKTKINKICLLQKTNKINLFNNFRHLNKSLIIKNNNILFLLY